MGSVFSVGSAFLVKEIAMSGASLGFAVSPAVVLAASFNILHFIIYIYILYLYIE